MKIKKKITITIKLTVIICILTVSLSLVYYGPKIPPFLKPLVPIKFRYTNAEIIDQIRTKNYDKHFLAFFNRDPKRSVPKGKNIIVAPADGTIKVVKKINGRYRIVVYMSLWDVHIQRVPISGIVIDVLNSKHKDRDDFKCDNCYQKITKIETEIGMVEIKQVTSGLTGRIKLFLTKGQKVNIGDKLGSILLGSHVVVEFPINVKLCVKKGDEVYAGETIVAIF